MSHKSPQIAKRIERFHNRELDPYYLGYFNCFNRGEFYEAHDVLEELWLGQRDGPNYAFYKALIQFAGAFVHLSKDRIRPGLKLLKLAKGYLQTYPRLHEHLNLEEVIQLIDLWIQRLTKESHPSDPLSLFSAPILRPSLNSDELLREIGALPPISS